MVVCLMSSSGKCFIHVLDENKVTMNTIGRCWWSWKFGLSQENDGKGQQICLPKGLQWTPYKLVARVLNVQRAFTSGQIGTFKSDDSCRDSALSICTYCIAKRMPHLGKGFTGGLKKIYVIIFLFHSPLGVKTHWKSVQRCEIFTSKQYKNRMNISKWQ